MLAHLFITKLKQLKDRVDIISNRVGKYDEFTQAKIVKLFANQVCVVQNIAMKLKAEINHVETSTKKMGYGINMFRTTAEAIAIDIWEAQKIRPPLRGIDMNADKGVSYEKNVNGTTKKDLFANMPSINKVAVKINGELSKKKILDENSISAKRLSLQKDIIEAKMTSVAAKQIKAEAEERVKKTAKLSEAVLNKKLGITENENELAKNGHSDRGARLLSKSLNLDSRKSSRENEPKTSDRSKFERKNRNDSTKENPYSSMGHWR